MSLNIKLVTDVFYKWTYTRIDTCHMDYRYLIAVPVKRLTRTFLKLKQKKNIIKHFNCIVSILHHRTLSQNLDVACIHVYFHFLKLTLCWWSVNKNNRSFHYITLIDLSLTIKSVPEWSVGVHMCHIRGIQTFVKE